MTSNLRGQAQAETIEKIVNHGSDLSLTTGDNADVREPKKRRAYGGMGGAD